MIYIIPNSAFTTSKLPTVMTINLLAHTHNAFNQNQKKDGRTEELIVKAVGKVVGNTGTKKSLTSKVYASVPYHVRETITAR